LTGAQRGAAETALRELRGSKNATLAELATFQSLRLLPPNRIQATFSQRMAQTDALLTPLQLGPLLTAADQMRTQNQTDVAIGLWTRIATQCEPHYHFGATALGACVKQLGLEQRTDQVDAINKWSERFQAKQTSN
jgi:hypothetical protein